MAPTGWPVASCSRAAATHTTAAPMAGMSAKKNVMAAKKMGVAIDEVLFVANHEFDCVGAKAAGMHTAFIDRRQRPFAKWPHQPDLLLPSMTALADAMV